jgi:putative transposase
MTRKSYDSDVTDGQWSILKPYLEKKHPNGWGRPRIVDTREVLNAIFYLNKTGCQWRSLPHDFPSWTKCFYYFKKWRNDGTWTGINKALTAMCREAVGRNPDNPTAACIDSQSVKGSSESGGESSGFDGGKKVNGRKRHIVTDTMGYVLGAKVHAANKADTTMAPEVVTQVFLTFILIRILFADLGYQRPFRQFIKEAFGVETEVPKKEPGFKVTRKRWVVERTFAWISRQRRMSRDYERTTESSENMIYISMARIMLKQLCPVPNPWRKGEVWSPLLN